MCFINQPNYLFLKDLIALILTTSGIVIAGMGLSTWRKQIRGSKEFKTSYNLHYSLLKLRSAIKHVRNPAIWNAESYRAIQYFKKKYPERINDEDLEKKSSVYVYEMRWEEITKAFEEVESHLLAAEVLWGNAILEKIKPIRGKTIELNIALKQYLDPELRTKNYMDLHNIIYDQSDGNNEDAFSKDVNNCIENIANYLRQKIKKGG